MRRLLACFDNPVTEIKHVCTLCMYVCIYFLIKDILFPLQQHEYKRVAQVLLKAAKLHKVDFIQRIAIGLCNLLVCQVRFRSFGSVFDSFIK